MPGGKPVNNNFPCVSMMDWRGNGSDTARTWALQMTIDILGSDEKKVFSANVSARSGGVGWPLASVVYSIGFELASGQRVILLSNTNSSATTATVLGASGGTVHTVDESAGYGEVSYSSHTLTADRIELTASSFVLIELKKQSQLPLLREVAAAAWDWRDVNGTSWLNPKHGGAVRDQNLSPPASWGAYGGGGGPLHKCDACCE